MYNRDGKFLREILAVNPGTHSGFIVDGDLSYILRRMKQANKASGRLMEVYENSYYTKPSDRRRKLRGIAKYNQRKLTERDNICQK